MNRGTHAAKGLSLLAAAGCIFALSVAGCQSKANDKDKKIAELEQQLQAAKAQGTAPEAPKTEPAAPTQATPSQAQAGAPGKTPATGAPAAKPPRSVTADQYAKEKGAARQEYEKDKTAVKEFADQQRATNAQQAATNEQVQRQIDNLKPAEVTLPEGTVIAARPSTDLSTDKLKDGSTFEALLEADLVANDVLVAKKGAHVTGVVVSSDPGGRVKGVASLQVAARSIEGLKGTTIRIHTDSYATKADTSKGKDAARTGILAGAGAVVGAIAGGGKGAAIGAGAGAAAGVGTNLATRGKAAVIPAETLIEFRLTSPVTVVVPR